MEIPPTEWNFPNPLSTPKATNVHQAPFQTPRTNPPSHFADAFYTPQTQPPTRTPALHGFAIARREAKNTSTPITTDHPKFHVNHYQTSSSSLPLPPVEPSRQLSSSPDPQATSTALQRTLAVSRSKTNTAPMSGFQMQTPPPTRDSTSRRRVSYVQAGVQSTPSNVYQPVPMSTPAQQPIQPNIHQTPTFQTPGQFVHPLQFSPDVFGFTPNGPFTAPAIPQSRFPWDSSPPISSFQQSASIDVQQGPFGQALPINPPVPTWPSNNVPTSQFPTTFASSQTSAMSFDEGDFWRAPHPINPQATTYSSDGIFTSPTAGVNPNLLTSFSSPPQPLNSSAQQQDIDFSNKQPYEHQMKDATREKELARKAKLQHNRAATVSSSRPGLQRSNTDSGFRRRQNRSFEVRGAVPNLEAARKPSPLKRLSQASLSSIPESSRPLPRTRLVIDEDGRARTETEPVNVEEPRSLWDAEDSDDEDDVTMPSQRNSFANPAELTRSSKHARNDSSDNTLSASKRPLSSASLASLASRLESTPLGKKNPRDSADSSNRRFSIASFGSSQGQPPGGHDDVFAEERDTLDARDALKRVVQERSIAEQSDPQATLRAHNQRWSQASLNIDMSKLNSQQMLSQQPQYDAATLAPSPAYGSSSNASSVSPAIGYGSALQVNTPSSTHSTISASDSSVVRCVCGSTASPGPQSPGMMVQCESCLKWLHVRCVGLNEARMPEVYVCVFCTGTTPVARGGRIRDTGIFGGVGIGGGQSVSPLNYKNNPFKR